MSDRRDVLREVMNETSTTQVELALLSGVQQPSISQFLSGRREMSDAMLDRLLACMGYRVEVVRRPVKVALRRSPERSWRLHRRLATHLTSNDVLDMWRPTVSDNFARLHSNVRGEPHLSNLDRWHRLLDQNDLSGLRRVMTGLDDDSIQMREVSPLGGLLPNDERRRELQKLAG